MLLIAHKMKTKVAAAVIRMSESKLDETVSDGEVSIDAH